MKKQRLQTGKRLLAAGLSIIVVVTATEMPQGFSVHAEEEKTQYTITSFTELEEEIAYQALPFEAKESDILLPDTLKVRVRSSGEEETTETISEAGSETEPEKDSNQTEGTQTETSETEPGIPKETNSEETEPKATEQTTTEQETSVPETTAPTEGIQPASTQPETAAPELEKEETPQAQAEPEAYEEEEEHMVASIAESIRSVFEPIEVFAADEADLHIDKEQGEERILEHITWKLDSEKSALPEFDSSEEADGAVFFYTPVLPQTDKDGNSYVLAQGLELPEIVVMIGDYGIDTLEVKDVTYLDIDGSKKTAKDCTILTDKMTTLSSGWYAVKGNLTIGDRITTQGEVHLILTDGCTLNATKGITVSNGNSLAIYAQSNGGSKGKLIATGKSDGFNFLAAGIGSYKSHQKLGTIIIAGGNIEARGGETAAGIGSGYSVMDQNGSITIYNGEITASGGSNSAGIGTGPSNYGGQIDIKILGGSVKAQSGADEGRNRICGIGNGELADTQINLQIRNATVVSMRTNGEYDNLQNEKVNVITCSTVNQTAVGHNKGTASGTVITPATCTEDGVVQYNCVTCLKDFTVPTPAIGHNIQKVNRMEATCTEDGNIEYYTCENCHKMYKDELGEQEIADAKDVVLAKTGHSMTKTEKKEATCTEDGNIEYYTCGNCHKMYKDELGKQEITDAKDVVLAQTGHSMTKTEKKAATCTEDGNIEYYICDTCGKWYWDVDGENIIKAKTDVEIKASGHKMRRITSVEATCTTAGNKEYYICDTCGKWYWDVAGEDIIKAKTDVEIKASGHTMRKIARIEATCITAGNKEYYICDTCGKWYWDASGENIIKAKTDVEIQESGHKMQRIAREEATCTTDGNKEYYTCDICGKWYWDVAGEDIIKVKTDVEIKASGHKMQRIARVEATCITAGNKEYYICDTCGKWYWDVAGENIIKAKTDVEIQASGHTIAIDSAVAATCTVDGLTEGKHCSVCQEVLEKQKVVKAVGHQFGKWENVTSPSCTDKGSEKRECTVCGYTETREVEANGHDWESDYTIDKEATCTEDGSRSIHCKNCDVIKDSEVIKATGHQFGEWENVTSPSCTEKGSEKRECSVCGYTETREVEASGHDWEADYTIDKEATCTEDGSRSIHCKNCDETKDSEIIPALGHEWDEGTITTKPTVDTEGVKTYTCERCHETKTEAVAKIEETETETESESETEKMTETEKTTESEKTTETEKDTEKKKATTASSSSGSSTANKNTGSPSTGDESNAAIWMMAMLLSAEGILVTLLRRNRKRKMNQ